MRTFIAIDLPATDPVRQLTRNLKSELKDIRATWTNPDISHLTLAFPGEITPGQVEILSDRLRQISIGQPTLEMELQGIGIFGRVSQPKVLWIGIRPQPALTRLWEQVSLAIEEVHLTGSQENFRPHLTLARIKETGPVHSIGDLVNKYCNLSLGRITTREFILYQSTLTPSGPIYTPVSSFSFR